MVAHSHGGRYITSRPALLINGAPAVIPHWEMERIEAKEVEERKKAFGTQVQAGDAVRVIDTSHGFYDMLGAVERMEGKDRVRVLIRFSVRKRRYGGGKISWTWRDSHSRLTSKGKSPLHLFVMRA